MAPDDIDAWWRVELGPAPPVTTRYAGHAEPSDLRLTGSAVGLYLALWDRSADEADVHDESGHLDGWREQSPVRWSR